MHYFLNGCLITDMFFMAPGYDGRSVIAVIVTVPSGGLAKGLMLLLLGIVQERVCV